MKEFFIAPGLLEQFRFLSLADSGFGVFLMLLSVLNTILVAVLGMSSRKFQLHFLFPLFFILYNYYLYKIKVTPKLPRLDSN